MTKSDWQLLGIFACCLLVCGYFAYQFGYINGRQDAIDAAFEREGVRFKQAQERFNQGKSTANLGRPIDPFPKPNQPVGLKPWPSPNRPLGSPR